MIKELFLTCVSSQLGEAMNVLGSGENVLMGLASFVLFL